MLNGDLPQSFGRLVRGELESDRGLHLLELARTDLDEERRAPVADLQDLRPTESVWGESGVREIRKIQLESFQLLDSKNWLKKIHKKKMPKKAPKTRRSMNQINWIPNNPIQTYRFMRKPSL